MKFPERFSNLPEYAFPRLRNLLDCHAPGGDVIAMTIGEPRHGLPDFVAPILADEIQGFTKYPNNNGSEALLSAISNWLKWRFDIRADADREIMALNGTREGLMNACMALCPEDKNGSKPYVLSPNPFYQVYAVAALAAGAEPLFVPALAENNFLPDYAGLPSDILDKTAIVYLCSPSNPQGAIAPEAYLKELIELAHKHDFKIFSDECYSEIYSNTAPPSSMEVAQKMGADPERVVIFHSLSKRSNMPGLRSGFVASGPENIERIRKLRAYSGAPVPNPIQAVSTKAWSDEEHVIHSRQLYVEKFKIADEIFANIDSISAPEAGFFLWLPVEDGEEASLKLWRETGVRTLPGAYLSRDADGKNPGKNYIRAALVAPKEETKRGLEIIRECLYK